MNKRLSRRDRMFSWLFTFPDVICLSNADANIVVKLRIYSRYLIRSLFHLHP